MLSLFWHNRAAPGSVKPRLQKSRTESRYSWTAFPLQWIRQIDAPLLVIYFSPKHVNVYTLIGTVWRGGSELFSGWTVEGVESSKKVWREKERGREKEETIRGYTRCLFSSMIKFFFFPPPSAFYRIYPAFWSQTLFVFCSHFCAGTIVYKSFDSARRKKKKEKKEETVEMEK